MINALPDGGALILLAIFLFRYTQTDGEILRTGMEGVLKGPEEGGILRKARLLRRLHHRNALPDQLSRPQQPLLHGVLVDGVAGDLLEPVH